MLIVETIRKVRMALAKGESQREVARKCRMSRNTVRKIAENGEAIVIGVIYTGICTPTEAASIASVTAILITVGMGRHSHSRL